MVYSGESVIRRTAKRLGLNTHPGEPLRLDAVMSLPRAVSWFPIQVAIEHENDPRTVASEIRALASVRAPLKVLVTYALRDYRNPDAIVERMPERIATELGAASMFPENESTEYLFLIGKERAGLTTRDLEWWTLSFTAGDGGNGRRFELASTL